MTNQDIVNEITVEVGGSLGDDILQNAIFACLKAAYRRVPTIMRARIFCKQGSIVVASQAYEQAINSGIADFISERSIWWLTADNIRVPILPHRSVQDFHSRFAPNLFGKPGRYLIYNNSGVLYIQLDRRADQNLTVGFDYFCSTSNIALTDNYSGDEKLLECFKGYGMERYYRNYEEDKSKADDNKSMADILLKELEGDYEAQELGHYIENVSDY